LGCDSVQGYFLARPMPVAELVAWLATQPKPVASHD
jgi:EAL domain-containing protein (putative c-di-GMP-specific phosphodiesterase class I)